MRILGIETSCDETAIAVIEMSHSKRYGQAARIKILSNVVLSQISIHRKFGGVVPNLAKREHQRNLVPILLKTLKEAKLVELGIKNYELVDKDKDRNSKFQILNSILEREPELFARIREYVLLLKPPKIDAIAVTAGPGLEPALWAGVNFARALSFLWKKPVIPVNHLEGHIYTATLGEHPIQKRQFQLRLPKLPTLVLIVSGGHTELVMMKKFGSYSIIGETRDDAAGEAFDKVARLLGLGYPGGPQISALAEISRTNADNKRTDAEMAKNSPCRSASYKNPQQSAFRLPRPMINSNDFDFSFSGLKTAVLYLLQDLRKKYSLKDLRAPIAKEFQDAVVEVLVAKTIRAAKKYKAKTIVLGGGVAANKLLRETIVREIKRQLPQTSYQLPSIKLTGDNALMIALAGYFLKKKKTRRELYANAGLRLGIK